MFEDWPGSAERGCIDMLFFGDGTGIPGTWRGTEEAGARWGIQWPRQDMSPYITAMSRVTKHIGFGLTYSSTFMHPFYVARLLNSLDHVTGGRMAFNVVASTRRSDAANYGFDELMEHNSRYERMEEFVDVCKALWASVEPDAFVWDRETGMVCDPAKVHPINHRASSSRSGPAEHRAVAARRAGPDPGRRLAARHQGLGALCRSHLCGQPAARRQVKHRKALDEALVAEGRDPGASASCSARISSSARPRARQPRGRAARLLPEEAVGAYLSHNIGYDFSTLPENFYPAEVAAEIAATQASPVSFVSKLSDELGPDAVMTAQNSSRAAQRLRPATTGPSAARRRSSPTSWRRNSRRPAAAAAS